MMYPFYDKFEKDTQKEAKNHMSNTQTLRMIESIVTIFSLCLGDVQVQSVCILRSKVIMDNTE